MSDLIAKLDKGEADMLWWQLMRGLAGTQDELEHLEKAPPDIRNMLYGPGILEATKGVRDDLVDLLDDDLLSEPSLAALIGGCHDTEGQ